MALWLATLSDLRAQEQAERAEASENELIEVRKAALAQAQDARRQADATQAQVELWREEQAAAKRLDLALVNAAQDAVVVGDDASGHMELPSFHFVNFSAFPVFIESVYCLPVPGAPMRVTLARAGEPGAIRGFGAMLAPGEVRHMDLQTPKDLTMLSGMMPNLGLEYGVEVTCTYPGQGRVQVRYSVRFSGWDSKARVMDIHRLPVSRDDADNGPRVAR